MNENEIYEKLSEFIRQELLGRPEFPIAGDQALISGGLIDSFSLAQIGVFVERAFSVYIPDNDLTVVNMDTLDQMVARIKLGLNS